MDWLSKYDGVIQCAKKAVKLTKKDGTSVEFVAMVQSDQDSMLNLTKAIALEDIKVVREYPEVFLAELPGMPPDRDIEFLIELLPGTPPISRRPYRMPINELVELKKYCNATFARRMQPELRREIEYLNLGIVSEAKVTMEVEPALEVKIREGQLEDAKLKEIRQLIRDNKTSDSSEDSQGTLWLGRQICVPDLKPIKESILR
jgi:hypothetical protein